MLIRKPRGTGGPFSIGLVLLLGVGSGVYIWGPALHEYLNNDPEVLAFREKSKLNRQLNKDLARSE